MVRLLFLWLLAVLHVCSDLIAVGSHVYVSPVSTKARNIVMIPKSSLFSVELYFSILLWDDRQQLSCALDHTTACFLPYRGGVRVCACVLCVSLAEPGSVDNNVEMLATNYSDCCSACWKDLRQRDTPTACPGLTIAHSDNCRSHLAASSKATFSSR